MPGKTDDFPEILAWLVALGAGLYVFCLLVLDFVEKLLTGDWGTKAENFLDVADWDDDSIS